MTAHTGSEPVEFIVLTGALGSGKTTLLSALLETPEAARSAVIVNEIGEVDLDGAILRETGADVPMALMANGCVCCQMGSSLATTIEALFQAPRPGGEPLRRIVLETSGLSKPGPVLRQLSGLWRYRLRIAVVATYDCVRGLANTASDEGIAQVAAAHRIVATKLDLVSDERRAAIRGEVTAINPLAEVCVPSDRRAVAALAFAPLAAAPAPIAADLRAAAHHPRVVTRLVRPASEPTYDALARWLDNLTGVLGDRLLRLKGLVRVADCELPLLVQSVGTMLSPPRPFNGSLGDTGSFVVVILRDLASRDFDDVEPRGLFV